MVSSLEEYLEEFEVEEPSEEEYEGELYIAGKPELKPPRNTGTCILLSVSYSGEAGKALLKLYDLEKRVVHFWYDDTGHRPYCLTDMSIEELKRSKVVSHPGFLGFERVKKFDALRITFKLFSTTS